MLNGDKRKRKAASRNPDPGKKLSMAYERRIEAPAKGIQRKVVYRNTNEVSS